MDYPKLRYGLEAFPVEQGGARLVLLRDRLGYSEEPLLLSPALAQLVTQMTGANSLRDLQLYHMRTTGELLFLEKLQEIVQKLDHHLFLETDRYWRHVNRVVAQFKQDPVRRMQHAGISYPADHEAARHQLEQFFAPESGGPGAPRGKCNPRKLLGLVAPHIDIKAGGPCFAHAYKVLCEADAPDVWVILGTGHEPVDNYFALTAKDFETVFDVIRCDHTLCEELLRLAPKDLLAGEYYHCREHTVEFQTLFLAYMQPSARIVPLLCSFSLEDWERDQGYIDEMANLLWNLAQTGRGRVGFIASVDLAHIGPRYGDAFGPHSGTVAQHAAADRELLQCLELCDASAFMRILHRERNQRRICGGAPLYVLAKILEGRAYGEILKHDHAVVDPQHSFVTFASMAFYETK